jgi:HEAT repeat protein
LIALARDKRPAVQETAVRALGRLDSQQGIPELLEALGDSRARFAIYAMRSALSEFPPSRVLEVMRKVPLGKVTVAKEAVRLAGEFGGAPALDWFTELDHEPLHRDVRGALLRALWDHLERPEAWAILNRSVSSPDAGVVIGLARIQVDRASVIARERVANLLLQLLQHSEPTVRLAVLNRLASQPVPDPNRLLQATTLSMLTSAIPDERSAALRAAIAAATDADAPAFATAFTGLLPKRREIASAAIEFAGQTIALGNRLVIVRSIVLETVETDARLVSLQIRLAAARFAAEPFAQWVMKLVNTNRWHAASQTSALEALVSSRQPAADLERAEIIWASTTNQAARWLALRLLARVASEQGWTTQRRERLDQYRRDPNEMVADEAALIFPSEREKLSS